MFFVPTAYARVIEQQDKLRKERNARYNKTRPERDRGKVPMEFREFVVWDGEGPKDTAYSLLGNSEGDELCGPNLRTAQCLDFILESGAAHPNTIHVGFGFNYDVSNILRELSWRHFKNLHNNGRIYWSPPDSDDVYKIEHIPRKWFRVEKDGVSVKIYDVISFFATSLVGALTKWDIGPFASLPAMTDVPFPLRVIEIPTVAAMEQLSEASIVQIFKSLRSEFLWKDIEPIRRYMRLELKYTKILMVKLRETFTAAGYLPTSWHGPAALSRQAIGRHKVYDAMCNTQPSDVKIAARYAFFGGRFEQFFGGHAGQHVYCADINSAYPYYCAMLPNLNRGTWRRTSHYEPNRFAVYHIRYHAGVDPYGCFPLPYRDSDHNVIFPHRTTGWYWSPEAALCANDPSAEFIEGWVFDEDDPTDKPFAWIEEYYRRRMVYKRLPTPAQRAPEFTFKLIINAIYGCLAQRSGWDKKKNLPPKTHQLEWAGFITSACRAQVYRVASALGKDLVSIDTDGITSLRPFDTLEDSKDLGGWELTEYDDGIFWQSGIYALKNSDGTWKAKMRGIERGTEMVDVLFECLRTGKPIEVKRNNFIGYGMALQGLRKSLNTWEETTSVYEFGGGGKRQHITPRGKCPKACSGDHHRFGLWAPHGGRGLDYESKPHHLPWIESSRKAQEIKQLMDDQTGYEVSEWLSIGGQVN
jgi:DNA polymerase type B, organellar and viral